jgi:hypothetical protein
MTVEILKSGNHGSNDLRLIPMLFTLPNAQVVS